MSLPDGWVREYDPKYKHHFWVDTKSIPPRATWVHPYEDEQFLDEHPEARPDRESAATPDLDEPPSYDAATQGCASGSGSREKSGSSERVKSPDADSARPSSHKEQKRGVFGKLKDKTIGTKEEREAQRQLRARQAARAEEQARQARMRELEAREAYMRAHGGYAPYHPSYGAGPVYDPYMFGPAPTRGDPTAALLLGGLAGGLLLGDIFGGGGLF